MKTSPRPRRTAARKVPKAPDSLSQRRAEEKEQRREAIIDAAERVFERTSFDVATMEHVARAARVSRALLYLYFKNKAELNLAICERALKLLRERFLLAAAQQATGYEQIRAIGNEYVAFAISHPGYFAALSRFEAHAQSEITAGSVEHSVFDCGSAVHQVTVDCIENGMRDGSVRDDVENTLLAAMSLWAFTHGTIQLAHTKHHFFERCGLSTAQFTESAIELGLRGLRPVADARTRTR